MTATDAILRKALVGSGLDTAGWSKIQAGLRDRAFFMAEVEKAKILHAAREGVADILRSGKSESEVIRELRHKILEAGYTRPEGQEGTIKDLLTKRRLEVMLRTNVEQARGYAAHLRATSAGALAAFPAYEFIRVKVRKVPRTDWPQRWEKAAREVGYNGVARGTSRMIALKTSPVWVALSAFGNPFPPFDFGSGMGLDDVDAATCRELGLAEAAKEQKPPEIHFNGSLQAEVPFKNDTEWQDLKESFGDQIQIDKRRGTVRWRDHLFEDNFDKGGVFRIRLGKTPKRTLDMLPSTINYHQWTGTDFNGWKKGKLTVTQDWLDNVREDGSGTDHRSHFKGYGNDAYPLEKRDVGLLSSLWHHPERAWLDTRLGKEGKNDTPRLILEIDGIDNFVYRAVVDIGEANPFLKTFFKYKKASTTNATTPPVIKRA